jgi:hypothetical protein
MQFVIPTAIHNSIFIAEMMTMKAHGIYEMLSVVKMITVTESHPQRETFFTTVFKALRYEFLLNHIIIIGKTALFESNPFLEDSA